MKKFFYSVVIIASTFLFISAQLYSQTEKDIKSELPKMLGITNSGTDFYFTVPPCYVEVNGNTNNHISIFVAAAERTNVSVSVNGPGYKITKIVNANTVSEFILDTTIAMPYTKLGRDANVPEKVYAGRGVHVRSASPCIVYVMVRFKYTSDGFLAIPVSALGTDYIIAGWNVDPMFAAVWAYKLPNMSGITAAYDNTIVSFTLGGNQSTKTAGGMTTGQTKQFTLNAGDVWMVSTDGDNSDLSGSKIISNKPVAVVTGNMCANIPLGNQWCDYIAEMDQPVYSWGKVIPIPKIPNRKNASIIRIFAKDSATTFYRDGSILGVLKSSGGIEGESFVTMRMVNTGTNPRSIIISGDKPINVTLYNQGVQEDGSPYNSPDPFSMSILSTDNYLQDMTFCVPGTPGGQNFKQNYINLVFESDSLGNMTDDFEFGTAVNGQFEWEKLKTKFPGTPEKLEYKVNGRYYAVKILTMPDYGLFRIKAKTVFGAYSFGFSESESYGYPAGANLPEKNNPIDTLCPVPKYTQHCNGDVNGVVTDMPDDNATRSNLGYLIMEDSKSYNYTFSYSAIIPGETRTTDWKAEVVDKMNDAKAVITFTDRRGNDTTIVLNYEAPKISITPNVIDFGILMSKLEKKTLIIIIKNNSTTKPFILTKINFNKTSDITIEIIGKNLPYSLAPMDSLVFNMTFMPTKMGKFNDTLMISDSCSPYILTDIKGQVGEPVIFVTDVDFGKVFIDSVMTKSIMIQNRGNLNLNISGNTGPQQKEFSVKIVPSVIMPAEILKVEVSFKPSKKMIYNDTIAIISDARTGNIKNYAILNGMGDKFTDVEVTDNLLSKVYPNPATKNISVLLNDRTDQIKSLRMINESGVQVFSIPEINSNEWTITADNLAPGVYNIVIKTSGGKNIVHKVTVIK